MTIRTLMDEAVRRWPERVAIKFRADGVWRSRTYREFGERIRRAAEGFGALGIVPRRDCVALWLENGPEWLEIYAALAGSGAIVVPLDPKLRAEEVAFILADAKVVAIAGGARQLALLAEILPALPALKHRIVVNGRGKGSSEDSGFGFSCQAYEDLLACDMPAAGGGFERHHPEGRDVASILYTSGTTGKPKGAMLTHHNFCSDALGALEIIADVTPRDTFLVVLPLFHAFSFTANFIVPLSRGCGIYFVDNLRSIAEDMRTLQPTILMAVPLLVEKMAARIDARLRASPIARILLRIGLGRVVGLKVRRTLGGRLRMLLTGGAPCPPDLLRGLRRLGIGVVEGYGLTEASPVVTLSRVDDARPGTIGYKLPNIELRIACADADGVGELQVRGPIVMKGYYRNEAATREAFDGPWLRTGDLASVDRDGYYTLRGRQKALIVNREGKNIYPEEVEQCLARHPYVLDVVVVGFRDANDTGEKVGAILTPNIEAIQAAMGGAGQPPSWPEIEALLRRAVCEQSRALADYKHPRRIEIRREPLERTATQKVRRHLYQGALDRR